jgi:hypothetical protein
MDRRIVGAAHRAEHLHGAIGDPLQHRGHRHLDQRDVAPGVLVAGLIQPPRAAIGEQPRLFEFDAGFGDPALHGVVLDHGAPKAERFDERTIISSIKSSHSPIDRMQ